MGSIRSRYKPILSAVSSLSFFHLLSLASILPVPSSPSTPLILHSPSLSVMSVSAPHPPSLHSEPVWPSGKAICWEADTWGLSPLWTWTDVLSASSSTIVVYEQSFVIDLTINQTLQWLRQLSTLLQSHVGGDSAASRCSSIRQSHKMPPPPLRPLSNIPR